MEKSNRNTAQDGRVGLGRTIRRGLHNMLPKTYFSPFQSVYPIELQAEDAGYSRANIEAIKQSPEPEIALETAIAVTALTGERFIIEEIR